MKCPCQSVNGCVQVVFRRREGETESGVGRARGLSRSGGELAVVSDLLWPNPGSRVRDARQRRCARSHLSNEQLLSFSRCDCLSRFSLVLSCF